MKVNWELASLTCIGLCMNSYLFLSYHAPIHDTWVGVEFFYFFYNEMYFNNGIAEWMPYGLFGMRSDVPFMFLSIAQHFMAWVGWLLGFGDVLFLFHCSLMLNLLVFLYGVHLLVGELYVHSATRWMVGLASLCSVSWVSNLQFNFMIYYMLPYVFYFFVVMRRKNACANFWSVGIASILSLVGAALYFSVLHFFICCIFFGTVVWFYPSILRSIFRINRYGVIAFSIFLFMCLGQGSYWSASITSVVSLAKGRQSDLSTSINDFLLYNTLSIKEQLSLLYSEFVLGGYLYEGLAMMLQFTYYIGWLPILLFFMSLWRKQSPLYYAFLNVALAMIGLSFCGFFAFLFYHFPFLSLFRYISYPHGITKLAILFCAGFEADYLITKIQTDLEGLPQFPAHRVVYGLAFILLTYDVAMQPLFANAIESGEHFIQIRIAFDFIKIFLYGALIYLWFGSERDRIFQTFLARFSSSAILIGISLSVFCFDVFSYRYALMSNMKNVDPPVFLPDQRNQYDAVSNVRPLEYIPNRVVHSSYVDLLNEQARNPFMPDWLAYRIERSRFKYAETYNYLQLDPCYPHDNIQYIMPSIERLRQALGAKKPFKDVDPAYHEIIGCGTSKLKVYNEVIWYEEYAEGKQLIAEQGGKSANVLFLKQSSKIPPVSSSQRANISNVQSKIVGFTTDHLELEIDLESDGPAWLYYSDAYDEDWNAEVNGEVVEIYEAFLAFKAIPIQDGKNKILFKYANTSRWLHKSFLMTLYAGIMAMFLAVFGVACFPTVKERVLKHLQSGLTPPIKEG